MNWYIAVAHMPFMIVPLLPHGKSSGYALPSGVVLYVHMLSGQDVHTLHRASPQHPSLPKEVLFMKVHEGSVQLLEFSPNLTAGVGMESNSVSCSARSCKLSQDSMQVAFLVAEVIVRGQRYLRCLGQGALALGLCRPRYPIRCELQTAIALLLAAVLEVQVRRRQVSMVQNGTEWETHLQYVLPFQVAVPFSEQPAQFVAVCLSMSRYMARVIFMLGTSTEADRTTMPCCATLFQLYKKDPYDQSKNSSASMR
jgi:hypothetical protein